MKDELVVLILAAGASSRMGKPKQLLPYKGKAIIQYTIDAALATKSAHIICLTGKYHSELLPILSKNELTIIQNKDWQLGIGSSIKTGVQGIFEKFPMANYILVLLSDQPLVNHALLEEMLDESKKFSQSIIACSYENSVGVPALFPRRFFPNLIAIEDNSGAKSLIGSTRDVQLIKTNLLLDVDAPSDYQKLIDSTQTKHLKEQGLL